MGLIKSLSGQFARIKVLGVGGGGNNAINSMISEGDIDGVDFIAINTDSQALLNSLAPIKIQIGEKSTKGLGAGGNPQIGQQSADESRDKIREVLEGTDMLFITGGMGGGTCTGAAPVIAEIAKKELGILTIAVITKPFLFEGTRRMTNAEEGITRLKENVDTLIVIPNQKVLEVVNDKVTLVEAFKIADSVLNRGTKAIADLITIPGLINLDFADIKSVMSNAGSALMGVGEAEGEGKAQRAIAAAIESPLVEVTLDGARGVLINITGGPDITMAEIEDAAKIITEHAAPDANIIFGATIDKTFKDKIKITVIATGFDANRQRFYINQKKTSNTSPIQNNQPVNNQIIESPISPNLKNLVAESDIPVGLDLQDEFDIPAFLRKNK
ncbi:cell division protein FtsZ [Candidatus Shapirobacteria bacterium]|nr:cell division protein FtsZ [Candidatus Shapirobacteria bacterium]